MALVCDPDKRQEALDETERYLRSLTAADFTEERIRKAVRQQWLRKSMLAKR